MSATDPAKTQSGHWQRPLACYQFVDGTDQANLRCLFATLPGIPLCRQGFEQGESNGDGDVRRLAAGSIVLAEDRTGKGHISRHPAEGQLVVHVDLLKPPVARKRS